MGFGSKKYKYTTWKEYIYEKRKLFLSVILMIASFLALSFIPFIRFPSTTRNEASLFVNYADNDVGVDIVPVGLKYNWYLDGVIVEFGTIDATGILNLAIMDSEGVYILELGHDQNSVGIHYNPIISNYTFVHGTTSDEIEIPTKVLDGYMFWEGGIPLDTQSVSLFWDNISVWQLVGTFITDSEGFVEADVIGNENYRWQIGSQLAITPAQTWFGWDDAIQHNNYTFALKVERGYIIVFLVILKKGGFRVIIFIFLF
ncbi:hypothetical protein LCGC14_1549640 [marine sediment metagenome]|uniref:Uncharacterized protein n=1 Tax=marine sediment metagenome TaxID=412755 RepID=A0A0F9LRI1_9ZZZZ